MKVHIEQGTPDKASHIASLVMEAMNPECCQNFAGPHHTLVDFHQMMERLIKMDDSQYRYLNTMVATNSEGIITGILVAYDGAKLKELRRQFIKEAIVSFGIDYSAMDAETEGGEFYIDSLAVSSNFRGKGIAKQLLAAAIEKARELGILEVSVLVNNGIQRAERFEGSSGFEYGNDTVGGGHGMRHFQYTV